MLVLWIELKVKPESREQFIAVATENARLSLENEPDDVLHFDVIEDANDPSTFYYYEIYAGPEAMDRHNATPHRLRYGEAVKDLLAAPITGAKRGSEVFTRVRG